MPEQTTTAVDGIRAAPIWPIAWRFALIIAAFKVIYSLLTRTTGLAGAPGLGLIGFVLTVVLLVVALRSYRHRNDGAITFGQGFGVAFVASVVAAVVRASVDAVYLAALGGAQLAARREEILAQMQANPAVDAQTMEAIRNLFEVVYTPGGIFVWGIVGGVVGWSIVSLILAAVLRKERPATS